MTKEAKKLVEDNHNLIYGYLHTRNMSIDEWYDILAIALCNAATNFDSELSSFATYATRCMNIAVHTELRHQDYNNRKIHKNTWSYEEKIKNELYDRGDATVQSILPNSFNTEEEAITNATFLQCYNKLNDRDKQIVSMLADGYNMVEIGQVFGLSCEAVRLIKVKFREMLRRKKI